MKTVGTSTALKPTPGQALRASDTKEFLTKYKEAWETRSPALAASLFTRDAHYKVDPFSEAIVGREAIHDYWAGATNPQENIRFMVRNFCHSGYILLAEWSCAYRDRVTGKSREIAGMFLADFYGKQVRAFREYWHSRSL